MGRGGEQESFVTGEGSASWVQDDPQILVVLLDRVVHDRDLEGVGGGSLPEGDRAGCRTPGVGARGSRGGGAGLDEDSQRDDVGRVGTAAQGRGVADAPDAFVHLGIRGTDVHGVGSLCVRGRSRGHSQKEDRSDRENPASEEELGSFDEDVLTHGVPPGGPRDGRGRRPAGWKQSFSVFYPSSFSRHSRRAITSVRSSTNGTPSTNLARSVSRASASRSGLSSR